MKDQIVENIKEIIKNWGSATEHITSTRDDVCVCGDMQIN